MIVKLKNVRLSFPNLFVPQATNDGDPRYNCVFLADKDSKETDNMKAAIKDVAVAKWGKKADAMLENLYKKDRVCMLDGNTKTDKEGKIYEGFEHKMAISASRDPSKGAPMLVDKMNVVVSRADGVLYGGCFVYATLELWAQDNKFGQRINATLRGVQFFKDGKSFSSEIPITDDEFEDLSDLGEDSVKTENDNDNDDLV